MVGNLWELLETCVNFGQLAVCDSHLQSMTVSGSQLITRITRTLHDPILAFSRIFRMVRRHVGSVMVLYFIAYSIHCVQSSERLFLPHPIFRWHSHQHCWMTNHPDIELELGTFDLSFHSWYTFSHPSGLTRLTSWLHKASQRGSNYKSPPVWTPANQCNFNALLVRSLSHDIMISW